MSTHSAEQLDTALDRLRRLRHRLVLQAPPPDPDGSLLPILNASAEVCAIDTAIRVLESQLREVAS